MAVVGANLHNIVSEPLSTLRLLAKFPQKEKGPGNTERGDGSRLMVNPGQGGLPTLSASILQSWRDNVMCIASRCTASYHHIEVRSHSRPANHRVDAGGHHANE